MNWIMERLQEPSTWRGLIGLLTGAGVVISPALSAQIIAAGLAIMGAINVIRKEKKDKEESK